MNPLRKFIGASTLLATIVFSVSNSHASQVNNMQDLISQARVQSIQANYLNVKTSPTNPNPKLAFRIFKSTQASAEEITRNILDALGAQDHRKPLTRQKESVCKYDRSKEKGNAIPYGLVYYFNHSGNGDSGGRPRFSLNVIPCSLTEKPTEAHWAIAKIYRAQFLPLNDDHYVVLSRNQINQLSLWSIKAIRAHRNTNTAKATPIPK